MLLNVRLFIISLYGWDYLCIHWCNICILWVLSFLVFFNTHLYYSVGCLSMIIGHMLSWVSYMHVFCIFLFALVQRNSACFTWKGTLEICSILLLLLLLNRWTTHWYPLFIFTQFISNRDRYPWLLYLSAYSHWQCNCHWWGQHHTA